MLDLNVIQGRGFHNVVDGDTVTGFRFNLRNPNYRGIAASLLDGVEVVVDGERIPVDVPLWTLQGRTFTLDQLRETTDVRWQLEDLATITVPRPGGLTAGVHDIGVTVLLRRSYFPPAVSQSRFTATGQGVIVPSGPTGGLKFGVSTYSYSGDLYSSMTLEDAFAEIADLGATGIEILGEGNIPGYPELDPSFVDTWFSLLDTYGLTPTNYGAWVDTTRWRDRDLTAQEGAEQIQLDLRLAKQLGFTSVRPKFGVVSWALEPHPIWQEAVERSLDLATELDVIICPEVHAPTPIKHPVTQGYIDFIERTGSEHFKLLIDTGIFQTAPIDDPSEEIDPGEGNKRSPHLEALNVPMSDLVEVLPHVHFIQTKFFDIDDNLKDQHVPWHDIIPTLQTAGWSGYLSSEYEGQRPAYRSRDQVRRQHAILRGLAAGTSS